MSGINDHIGQVLGDWAVSLNPISITFRIALAVILSAIVGWERSNKRHSAGLRTFIMVTLCGTLASMLDIYMRGVFGSSFFLLSAATTIGATIIAVNSLFFSSRNQIRGLTTSAALCCCCLLGIALGAGFYTVCLIGMVALLFSLSILPGMETYFKDRSNHFEVHLELKSSTYLQDFVTTIRKLGLSIDAIEMNPAYSNSGLSVYSVAISISSQELKKYKTHKEIIEALNTLDYVYYMEEI